MPEAFSTLHAEIQNFTEAFTLADVSSLTLQQQTLTDLFALSDTVATVHSLFLGESDVLTLIETVTNVLTSGGGGVTLVAATGALSGGSGAAAVVAALTFASARWAKRTGHCAGWRCVSGRGNTPWTVSPQSPRRIVHRGKRGPRQAVRLIGGGAHATGDQRGRPGLCQHHRRTEGDRLSRIA